MKMASVAPEYLDAVRRTIHRIDLMKLDAFDFLQGYVSGRVPLEGSGYSSIEDAARKIYAAHSRKVAKLCEEFDEVWNRDLS